MSLNNNNTKVIEALSLDERIESKLSYMDKNHVDHANVEAVLTKPEGSHLLKQWYWGHNLVTLDGAIYYAQQGANATPTNDFSSASGRFILRNQADTPVDTDTYAGVLGPIAASNNTFVATYPKTNDTGDPDNTGDGTNVVSWCSLWSTSSFSDAAIQGGCIHNGGGTPAGSLLTHFSFASSFGKTTSDTLKVFVNHSFSHP